MKVAEVLAARRPRPAENEQQKPAPARSSSRRSARWRDPRRIGLLVVFVVASLFYAWTAASAGDRQEFFAYPDYYAQLTEGFLHGELSIPTPAPRGLVDLPDPYNPVLNAKYRVRFGDLALYHGRLYLDWGPTPVVTLYLPWHLLHLGTLSGNLALFLYSVAGLAGALALLFQLVDDFLPAVRARWVVLVGAGVAFGSAIPFIDREPDVYEVAVGAGYCFEALGCYLLASGCLKGRWRPARLGLASGFFGLAAAARQDLIALVLLLVAALAYVLARARQQGHLRLRAGLRGELRAALRGGLRPALVLLGPFAALMVLLALYNFARFHSFTQIGAAYQLAGFNPQYTPYYQLGYLVPSWYFYFVSPLHWGLTFPFISIPPPIAPMKVPTSYAPQIIGGIVSQSPILLVLLAAPFVLRRRLPRALTGVLVALFLTGLVIVSAIALSIPGGSERYVVDFATLFLVAGGLCWLAWQPRRRLTRVLVRGGGAVLVVYGILAGIAVSIPGYYDQITFTQPAVYDKLVSSTAGVGELVTKLLGHPVLTSITTNAGITSQTSWDSFGIGTVIYMNVSGNPAQLDIVAPHSGTYDVAMSVGPGPQYQAAGHAKIYLAVTDPSGTYYLRYHNGTVLLPLRLRGGDDTAQLSVLVVGKHLPTADSVLSCSGLRLGSTETAFDPTYAH